MHNRTNAKREIRLSPNSIQGLIDTLTSLEKDYKTIACEIVEKASEEMLESVDYDKTYVIPVRIEDNVAISGIKNDDPKWTYHEYGTGIIGSMFSHLPEELEKAGWKYDINSHGEKGWWYPTVESDPNPYKWTDDSGQLRAWTKGLPAKREFYDAGERIKERLPNIASEIIKKYRR